MNTICLHVPMYIYLYTYTHIHPYLTLYENLRKKRHLGNTSRQRNKRTKASYLTANTEMKGERVRWWSSFQTSQNKINAGDENNTRVVPRTKRTKLKAWGSHLQEKSKNDSMKRMNSNYILITSQLRLMLGLNVSKWSQNHGDLLPRVQR